MINELPDCQGEDERSASISSYPVHNVLITTLGSIYAKRLFDIEGNTLLCADNTYANVYHGLKELLDSKAIRLIHNMEVGYRYFITSEQQMNRFIEYRNFGSSDPGYAYCVYEDEDMNTKETVDHARSIFFVIERKHKKT